MKAQTLIAAVGLALFAGACTQSPQEGTPQKTEPQSNTMEMEATPGPESQQEGTEGMEQGGTATGHESGSGLEGSGMGTSE